jgi:hypothetical protein
LKETNAFILPAILDPSVVGVLASDWTSAYRVFILSSSFRFSDEPASSPDHFDDAGKETAKSILFRSMGLLKLAGLDDVLKRAVSKFVP